MPTPVHLNGLSQAHLRRAASTNTPQPPATTTESTSLDYTELDLKTPDLSITDFKLAIDAKLKTVTQENKFEVISELTETLDLFLQDIWKDYNQTGKKDAVLEGLKKILGERGQGNIVMAQINTTPGDIEGNSKKVMSYIKAAEAIGIDTLIFPELTLMGYPIHDTIDRHPFLVEQNMQYLEEIAKRTGKTKVVVGFVEPRKAEECKQAKGKDYFNSLAVLEDGKIEGIVRKSLLPTYGEFNDYRYIEPSPAAGMHPPSTLAKASWAMDNPKTGTLMESHNHSYGIAICEDGWNDADFFTRPMYDHDPIAEILKLNPEVLTNSSSSPTKSRKEQLKHNMLSFVSQKYGIPYCYVNQVGGVDDLSFEGASRAYDKDGKLIARAKSFSEQFMVVNPLEGGGKIYPLPKGLEDTITDDKVFSLDYENDMERTYLTIVQGIRDYYQKTGFKKAVLGLSGGLDSTICAVLLADALGPENVYGVSMPSEITPGENKDDARILAENLGINFLEVPIANMVDTVGSELSTAFNQIEKVWDRSTDSTTDQNAQARIRALILWSISNEFKDTMPIATSDKSEIYLGYATINGDMSGGFAPIADVVKTKLFALGRWMNENRAVQNAIPGEVLTRKPSADLEINPKTGETLTAEDDNMPYEFLDEIIWRIENLSQDYNALMNETFLYEQDNTVTKDQKEKWLDKFYRKMSFALYKWSILPPSVLVDSRSINKADYRQPIVSSRINWKGVSADQIRQKLDGV